jgi:hypothetical protein
MYTRRQDRVCVLLLMLYKVRGRDRALSVDELVRSHVY